MRWALVKVCLAVTVMVVVAFAIPLGLVVREMARDRALSGAERRAAALGPTLSITTDRNELTWALAAVQDEPDDRMALHIPAGGGQGAIEIGPSRAAPDELSTALRLGRASLSPAHGGSVLLQPTALSSGRIAVVEVFVPQAEMSRGVFRAWLVLGGVGLALIAGSVAVADRLGVRMVIPAKRLARAAHELGEGRLGARVREDGPAELRLAAVAFNSMADQVLRLLANERELAADLSHRLRTPLTVLRLNAASLGRGPAAEQTRAAVEQLEHEVDTIIRTARAANAAPLRPSGPRPGAGCDAAEVIRERMGFWSALAEDEGRTARMAGVEQPVRVPVAAPDLAAALDALLGNVFRHTPEGTAFAVDVHNAETTENAENAVLVLVSDAGPGIIDPQAALARGASSGGAGSTGLGLDIVRRLAESTGGDLRIERSVLGGTEVRIRLRRGAAGAAPGRSVAERLRRGHRVARRRGSGTERGTAGVG